MLFKAFVRKRWSGGPNSILMPGCQVVSDGLACFSVVKTAGCQYTSVVTGGGPACVSLVEFTWVNTMIGNVKNGLRGAYHAINHRHLPRYLAEFCYRFNRRFELDRMLPRFCFIAVRTPPMAIRLLKLAEVYGYQETLCLG